MDLYDEDMDQDAAVIKQGSETERRMATSLILHRADSILPHNNIQK